jgi:transposase InsO family protein
MPRQKKYPDELLDRGARMVFDSGRPVAHVARDLGIHHETLRKWVRKAEADAGVRKDLLNSEEREELKELRGEVRELRRANDILKSASAFSPPRSTHAERGERVRRRAPRSLRVEPICKTLEISASAYYQRARGERSARSLEDERPLARIREIHEANYCACGYRRTWIALRRAGEEVGRGRVARLMREAGIQGAKRRGRPWRTTTPDPAALRRPDLVQRDFSATGPDRLWVGDFTYLRSWEGASFFSFVIDAFRRKVVGWQLASHMRTDLVLDALRMALYQRGPGADFQLIAHTDRGSQYTSADYTQTLTDHGVLASVGTVGDALTTRWPRASSTPSRPS